VAIDLPSTARRRHCRAHITGHGTWPVTETGRPVLKGAARVTLRQDTLKPATRKAARAAANAAALAGDQGDAALFEALRRRRSELAKEQRVAAYVVFADKTLIDMARRKPATVAEMGAVHGVGAAKLRQYGEVFLDVIRQHAAGRP
jgi:ATP-dependent DNA helicase RecQ